MNRPLLFGYCTALYMLSSFVFGQIEEERVKIQKSFDPEVHNIQKPNLQLPDDVPIHFNDSLKKYSITDIPPTKEFEATPVAAQNLDIQAQKIYRNYVKGGFGAFTSILGEAGLNFQLQKSSSISVDANYLSHAGFSDPYYTWDTNESRFGATVGVKHRFDNGVLWVRANGNQHNYNLFGLANDSLAVAGMNVAQRLTNFGASAHFRTHNSKWLDEASVQTNFFSDDFSTKENFMNANGKLFFDLSEVGLSFTDKTLLKTEVELTHQRSRFGEFSTDFGYTLLGATPQLQLETEQIKLTAGANVQLLSESESSTSEVKIAPAVQFSYAGSEDWRLFVDATGGVRLNSFRSLLQDNLFLAPIPDLRPTFVAWSLKPGLEWKGVENLTVGGSFSYERIENQVHFEKVAQWLPDASITSPRKWGYLNSFTAAYADVTRTAIEGYARYYWDEKLEFSGRLSFQQFKEENDLSLFYLPNFLGNISVQSYWLKKRLQLGGQVLFTGSRKAQEVFILSTDGLGNHTYDIQERTLSSFLDVNLTGAFTITEQLAVWAGVYNLLNTRNEFFIHYPMLGMRIMGGLSFKF